jgi:hypothetical protein
MNFQAKKSVLLEYMMGFVENQRVLGHPLKYLRCDAVGENKEPLKKLCLAYGIIIEKTAPDTSQQNGVVERHIITLLCTTSISRT